MLGKNNWSEIWIFRVRVTNVKPKGNLLILAKSNNFVQEEKEP